MSIQMILKNIQRVDSIANRTLNTRRSLIMLINPRAIDDSTLIIVVEPWHNKNIFIRILNKKSDRSMSE